MSVDIKVPEMGESIVEATVANWLKKEGDPVAVGEPIVQLETDKVNLDVSAQQNGILERIVHPAGDTVKVGEVLAVMAESDGVGAASPKPEPDHQQAHGEPVAVSQPAREQPAEETQQARATPVARRMAEAQGVELSEVTPKGERITKQDVQAYLEKTAEPAQQPKAPPQEQPVPAAQAAPPPRVEPRVEHPAGAGTDRETRIRMSRRRQTIARRLVEAQQTAAMLTTFNEIDMSKVIELRKRRREAFKERFGVDLGYMGFFIKAVIGGLKAFPYLNAEIQGDEIVLKQYYDIGIAIGAEEGLVVPVVRDADRLNFAQLEQQIREYVRKSQEGSLTLDDLRGGTFTITNGGVFGSLLSTPILNPPQVGILGMHAIQERPVAVNGEPAVHPMMYVALTYDHRIVDGRIAVQFLVRVKELVEDPESLLLG